MEDIFKVNTLLQTQYNRIASIRINNISDDDYKYILDMIDYEFPKLKEFINQYISLNVLPKIIEYELVFYLTYNIEGYTKETLILNLARIFQDIMVVLLKCQNIERRKKNMN